MSTISYHVFKVEHCDWDGRRWCATCRLPENNPRAEQLHALPPVPVQRDWRARAWLGEDDEGGE